MRVTFPATKADIRADLPGEIPGASAREPDGGEAPDFALLDLRGPRAWALALSFASLGTLLALAVLLAHLASATPLPRTEFITEIFVSREPLRLPASRRPLNPRTSETPRSRPVERVSESPSPSVPLRSAETAAKTNRPTPGLQRPPQNVLPLPLSDVVSRTLKLIPPAPGPSHFAAGDAGKPAPETLGTLPLPKLIEREAALAATLAALPPEQRLALPRVSIRVDAEWLQALPQTQEKLYFSFAIPQADTEALAYSPASRSFTVERPLRPLWQIRDAERVPPLAALRSAAARRLGVAPEFVGLYTWHPPVFENALRMFVLERMQQLGMRLGPRDVVTVRLVARPGGCIMNLEPIRSGGSR